MSSTVVEIPGYQIAQTVYQGSRTLVYRASRESDGKPVVIKLLKNPYPSFSELVQFRNQYTIAKNLHIPGIVPLLALENYRNSYILVMADEGYTSLHSSVNYASNLGEFLHIALQIVDIMQGLYQNRIIHKDIKPANILIHPETKEIKLIDFSIASLLPKEKQSIHNPNTLEGTLAYMSPEQTGRMNRGIDYRTDFYSLGVTFYELLTGKLPFESEDPMELVHCHLAKEPISISSANIPQVLSEIVMKLMSKIPEQRYQSVRGLKHDLEKCLYQLKETGKIETFAIAQKDICDRFLIPEKLYGREAEVEQLLAAFEHVTAGNSELILVAGFSGIGKTAVVNEVHKPIVQQRGYFIKGKFDQFNRNIPFSALVQALRDLMGQLLSESDVILSSFRSKISQALGENGQVIIDVIPELEQIIGKQPLVPELSGSAAQNRFNLLFSKFIQVFTTKEHPLVIFLDDLQWADSASLNLMKLLMSESESGYLLLIGAYRDNEVFPAHPLMLILDEIAKVQAKINTITLAPLSGKNINDLIADTLSCSPKVAQPLTELVYRKTQGNPFFTNQFLVGLHGEKLIKFDVEVGYWECDIAQVKQLALTDDVVEFMATVLQKLPQKTQKVLRLAACVGNQFDLTTLAIVSELSEADVASALWGALQEGLVLPQSQVYKFFQDSNSSLAKIGNEQVNYKFLHDRVQQAAYALITEDDKQKTHLKIGQLLLANTPEKQREEEIFAIVNQLNIGVQLITEPSEIHQLAHFNLIAAKKAKNSTAYASAAKYLNIGRQLLPFSSWEDDYNFTLAFYQESVEAAYLNTDFVEMEKLAEVVQKKAKNILDCLKVYEVQIQAGMAQNQLIKAIKTGRKVLASLGINFPEEPDPSAIQTAMAQTFSNLAQRNPLELIDLPVMSDSSKLAAMRIIKVVIPCAYQAAPMLLPLLVMEQVNLSINYGNSAISSSAYGFFGLILCGVVEDIATGYQFGQLALNLLERFDNKQIKVETIFVVNADVKHYQEPVKVTLEPLTSAYALGLETGNLEFAALAAYIYAYHSYLIGKELTELNQEITHYNHALVKFKQQNALNFNQILQQMLVNLIGTVEEPCQLRGEIYDEQEMLPLHHQANDASAIYYVHFCKMILYYLLGEFEPAVEQAIQAEQYLHGVTANLVVPLFYFYSSLVQLSIYHKVTQSEQAKIVQKLQLNQEKMTKWASYAPQNFQHKYDLVEAEKMRILNNTVEAIELYDKAIAGAKQNEYIQEEALANELAAKFYLEWGKPRVASGYMQEAYYCYAKWGAKAKTDDLETCYPQLLAPILQPKQPHLDTHATLTWNPSTTLTSTSSTSGTSFLDLTTVIKASQAISGEIDLNNLISTLMTILLENAGADKGTLMLLRDDKLIVSAQCSSAKLCELSPIPVESSTRIPISLINYVNRTRKNLILNNLSKENRFAADEYFIQVQPKSVLCMPILHQSKLTGILYLENNLTTEAFTSERVEVLNLLCSQSAISLENARLYQQAQQALEDLQQAQLQIIQSEKMSALGNLVAGVAHEINNPVGFLKGNIKPAQDYTNDLFGLIDLCLEKLPSGDEEIVEEIEAIDLEFLREDLPNLLNSMNLGVERIKNISTSLRTFSRADRDYKTAFNLHDGLDSTLLILKHRLKANESFPAIKVVKNYGNSPEVECFPGQLNQVFMNILANAIDAFDEENQKLSYQEIETNSNQITIHTEAFLDGVTIRIKDNGSGMPEDVRQKIFDHLFTTKDVGKGTGLGLSIARQIVEQKHGGKLSCHSVVGQGTEFIIELPLG